MSKTFLRYFTIFIVINICIFIFFIKFNNLIKFNRDYYNVAVHFYEDPRINNKKFNFLKSTSVYDSQWYIEIARKGYPKFDIHNKTINLLSNEPHKYAFFPLYPLALYLINILIKNIEIAGYLLSFLFMIINFYLLYYFVTQIDSKKIAIKTTLLFFVFPLSIFFRVIYSEGIFLTLLLLFVIFLFKKRFYLSGLFLGLSIVTRANAFLLVFILLYDLYQFSKNIDLREKIIKFSLTLFMIFMPLLIWGLYNYQQTGSFFTFLKVRNYSIEGNIINSIIAKLNPLFGNLYRILEFPFLPLHAFADSKIEVISVFVCLYILIKSRKSLDYRLWWMSFIFWIFPLITTSLISYSRYQTVSFPIFYFITKRLNNRQYLSVFFIFIIGLFILSLYFANWYWLG